MLLLSTDHYVADLIATLGTADIVLGSVDKMKVDDKGNDEGTQLWKVYQT